MAEHFEETVEFYNDPKTAAQQLMKIHKETGECFELALSKNIEDAKMKHELEIILHKYEITLKTFLESPSLLEPYTKDIIFDLASRLTKINSLSVEFTQYCKYIFSFYSTVRMKTVERCFGQDIDEFVLVLTLVQNMGLYNMLLNIDDDSLLNLKIECKWQSVFSAVLLLTCTISLPFDLRIIDGQIYIWVEKFIKYMCVNQTEYSVCSEILPYLFTKFLKRADVDESYCRNLLTWCIKMIEGCIEKRSQPTTYLNMLACYLKFAVESIKSLYIFQNIDLERLLNYKSGNARKSVYKLVQRISFSLLGSVVSKQRCSHLSDLSENIKQYGMNIPCSNNDNKDKSGLFKLDSNNSASENETVSAEVEDIIGLLFRGLEDTDFSCRWSSAKGLGRIAERISVSFLTIIIQNVNGLIEYDSSSELFQGVCLFYGEIARKRLITTEEFDKIISKVEKALTYEDRYSTVSHGTFVRDTACYACWTFSRAFSPVEFSPYASRLVGTVLCVALFDRELLCRRAASAVLQEIIGRMGNIPHGLDIVTNCDYSNVKSLKNCYTKIAPKLFEFEEYHEILVKHLIEFRTSYWDYEIRILASEALALFATQKRDFILCKILPSIKEKVLMNNSNSTQFHGNLYAYSNIIYTLHEHITNECITADFEKIHEQYEKLNTTRPSFRNILSSALIHYFGNLSIFMTTPEHNSLQKISFIFQYVYEELINSIDKNVQNECLFFFKHICQHCSENELVMQIHKGCLKDKILVLLDKFNKSTLALCNSMSFLPIPIINSLFSDIWERLLRFANMDQKMISENTDNINIKVASVTLMLRLLQESNSTNFNTDHVDCYIELVFNSLEDYTINKHGDVGSKVRMAAVRCAYKIIKTKVDAIKATLKKPTIQTLVLKILRQCGERIQNIRLFARKYFCKLFSEKLKCIVSVVDSYEVVKEIIGNSKSSWELDDTNFKINMELMKLKEYCSHSLLGMLAFASLSGGKFNFGNKSVSIWFNGFELLINDKNILLNILEAFYWIFKNCLYNQRSRDFTIAFLEPFINLPAISSLNIELKNDLFMNIKTFLLNVKSTSVTLLKSIIDILVVSILSITNNDLKFDFIKFLASYISHDFPVIRVYAAEHMYTLTLTESLFEDKCGEKLSYLSDILLDTQWLNDKSTLQDKLTGLDELIKLTDAH